MQTEVDRRAVDLFGLSQPCSEIISAMRVNRLTGLKTLLQASAAFMRRTRVLFLIFRKSEYFRGAASFEIGEIPPFAS